MLLESLVIDLTWGRWLWTPFTTLACPLRDVMELVMPNLLMSHDHTVLMVGLIWFASNGHFHVGIYLFWPEASSVKWVWCSKKVSNWSTFLTHIWQLQFYLQSKKYSRAARNKSDSKQQLVIYYANTPSEDTIDCQHYWHPSQTPTPRISPDI